MVLGSWNPKSTICPFRARPRFKGKLANFEATNTVKQGKKAKRTNGTHFTRVHEGALTPSGISGLQLTAEGLTCNALKGPKRPGQSAA